MLMTPLSRVDISPELEKLAVEVARHIKAEQDLTALSRQLLKLAVTPRLWRG
jgi:predicted nucleic acid-binding OB-fold protein